LVETLNVVQIGAPYDTLNAGRSRAAYLGLAAGASGRLLVVEPLASSTERFRAFADAMLDCDTTVVTSAVWSSAGEVELFVDEAHPATNFSGTTVDYAEERKAEFKPVTVPSNTLDQIVDQIVADANFPQPDLVSITTNWAEEEILAGMTNMLEKGVRYVCLALGKDGEDYKDLMHTLGYKPLGFDDRGVTYVVRS